MRKCCRALVYHIRAVLHEPCTATATAIIARMTCGVAMLQWPRVIRRGASASACEAIVVVNCNCPRFLLLNKPSHAVLLVGVWYPIVELINCRMRAAHKLAAAAVGNSKWLAVLVFDYKISKASHAACAVFAAYVKLGVAYRKKRVAGLIAVLNKCATVNHTKSELMVGCGGIAVVTMQWHVLFDCVVRHVVGVAGYFVALVGVLLYHLYADSVAIHVVNHDTKISSIRVTYLHWIAHTIGCRLLG